MPNALPVPLHRQQSEGDCLPVCVQRVLAYWRLPGDRQDLITQLGADPDVGTPASRVLAWLAFRVALTLLIQRGDTPCSANCSTCSA